MSLRNIRKQDKLEYEFLPPALEIEETPSSPIQRLLIWVIFMITISVFIWSYFGRVDEVAVARGKIIPDGRIKVIQPMETGIIRAIHVSEGQQVKEGQLLIELDPTIKEADVTSTEKSLSIHLADKERLVSELSSKDKGNHNKNSITGFQQKLKEARESEYRAREDAIRFVIAQRESAILAAEAIITKLEKTYRIVQEQETAYRALHEQGYVAKMLLLDKQKDLYATEHELEAQRGIVRQGKEGLLEAKKNLEALKKEREKAILNDIIDREKSISAIEGEGVKAKKRFDFEKLTSPVNGTVHGLASSTIGGVVTPAQPIVTIVPEGTPLIIEAMAQNKDIGVLAVGQEAEIKLDTFPFQKYGTLAGKVASISPDAFEDEKLGPVYKMRVEPRWPSINVDGREIFLTPGMAVTVEVKTNKRRIIEFFLSPIIKYSKESLTLR